MKKLLITLLVLAQFYPEDDPTLVDIARLCDKKWE